MSFDTAYGLWLFGAIMTAWWLDRRVDAEGLNRRARRALGAMIYGASVFFPVTWAWVAVARTRRKLAYQRKH